MDTVRSEYSEGSLTSSRLDDGGATGRASLSFSFSNSHSSQVSIESASSRSDFLSSYERKFQERKAAKHKKSEKAKREKEKAERKQLFSADQRRQAEREAERQARRKEMETWLTDPNELRRIERRSQKRSRDRMRTLAEWYVPATSGPHEEVQPVFVAAMSQELSNQEHPSRKKIVTPLLSKEAAAIKDEEDREAMGTVLQRQLTAFTSKLEYLEQFTDAPTPVQVRAKTRAGPRRRRRVAREDMLLAPLGPAHSNLKAAKSVASLPTHYSSKEGRKLAASTSLQTLGPTSRVCVDNEDTEDMMDDAEVDEYLLRHRKVAKQVYAAVKLQATWRMHLRRRKYVPWRLRRTRHRRAIFEIWVMTFRVGYRAQYSLLRKYFTAWHADVVEALQLREMELHLFRQAATQTELPRMVLNLVFTSDWEDERATRLAAKAAEDAKKKDVAPSSKAAFLSAFLNSAFGDLEASSDKGRSRVHQLRAQHAATREEVRKKVVQHVFRLWKRVHEAKKRVGLNAQLCLKRAVRMAFGTRQRWPAEILLSVFEIWARWASFNRCKRLGLPLPHFAQSNPHWDIWLHNYQERQVRCVKAAAKAPGARLRRYFLRLHAFARRVIRERYAVAIASEHFSGMLKLKVLLEWREAIADSAAEKKLLRGVLLRLHRYACAKRKLRPLKDALRKRQRGWCSRRVWRGWKRVQLHACFKRELNVARLENSQAWRSRIHRTLDIWRDERNSLLLWRTFEAWTHFVRKRKLFLTLRLLCARLQRRNLLFGVFNAWKAAGWDRVDGFLEDSLRLDAWDTYRELSVFFPMMFYGRFSDAGSIFGGLPSHMYGESGVLERLKEDKQELLLSTSGDAVRHFHGVLVRDSVVEVRNAILQTRHLVNAVDDASGNTALHVAALIEEPERRLEILSLLLSEGAATLKRVNRHGLSPVQLAPDPATRLLLDKGIFAFHSHNILKREGDFENNHRLLWCMATLMTRELGTGLRTPAHVRTGQWFSTLRDELWLRQKHIRFAPDSTFAPTVARSRGFLNALKTRLCLTHQDVLAAALAPKPLESNEAGESRYHECEERFKTKNAKATETGEYEAYGRYLLATTLDAEACEQELIPSFVGLLFSLEFSIDDVVSQAYRLEEQCTAAESELWELYQRIQRAEKAWSTLFAQGTGGNAVNTRNDVGMLRLLSDDAAADLMFKREIFLLEFEQFNARDRSESQDGMDIQQEALALEIDTLMIRTKRKMRKAEKKVKRLQEQIDESSRAYREVLFASGRSVADICVTRMNLEHARLRMTMALIKHSDAKAVVERFEYAKQVLQSGERSSDPHFDRSSLAFDVLPPSVAALTSEERNAFLEKTMARYSHMFQTRVILEESHAAEKTNADNVQEFKRKELPEALRPLQKKAVNKLHTLFVLNSLRSCCCWLAENLIAMDAANNEENSADTESEGSDGDRPLVDEGSELTRLLSSTGAVFAEGISRRRSSITNTRRVLETYQHGSSMDVLDPDSETMNATYAASAMLLFEEERRTAEEAERERINSTKVETVAGISEHNPVTGELELPPDHLVSIEAISVPARTEVRPAVETKEIRRNRKKEELQRAMMHRRLQHRGGDSESDSEDNNRSSRDDFLPVIHGIELNFGNFVAGDGVWSKDGPSWDKKNLSSNAAVKEKEKEAHDSATSEAMWKRGGVKLVDSSAPSIKQVLAQAHRISTSRQKLHVGSRRQGLVMQEPPEVPLPLEEVPETQTESTPQGKVSEDLSSANEQQKAQRQDSVVAGHRSLDRAASASSLLTDTALNSTSPVSTAKVKPEDPLIEPQRDEKQLTLPHEDVATGEMQLSTRSRQNSASSKRSGRSSTREETNSAVPSCRVDSLNSPQHDANETTELRNTSETNSDACCHVESPMELHEREDSKRLRVDWPTRPLQSPVVEISTSRTSDSRGERRGGNESAQTLETSENRSRESDTNINTVNASIKWEEGAALEAFPLAVVSNNQLASVDFTGRERAAPTLSRVSSLRVATTQRNSGEMDEFTAARFVLDDNVENEKSLELSMEGDSELFTIQGKALVMVTKPKGARLQSSGSGVFDVFDETKQRPKQEKKRKEITTTGSIPLERPTPSITVTVVAKAAKQEVEAPEPIEILSVPLPPSLEKARMSPPKPFVKLEAAVEIKNDGDISASLQLEGMGLDNTLNANRDPGSMKQEGLQQDMTPLVPTHSSRLASRRNRNRVSADLISSDSSGLALQGARMDVKNTSGMKNVEKSIEFTGFEDMGLLSKAEKERLWQEFAAGPLSTSVRDAYTILYPDTYATAPNSRNSSQPMSVEPSASALRVDSTRDPQQKALERNRKFWSAVEGYRAIGTSSLVPLDAATISQRRQDKAQAIFDQFVRGQRDNVGSRESRALASAWLDMYPKEVAEVRRQLSHAPKGLFDELQRTAELQISAALAKRQTDEASHY